MPNVREQILTALLVRLETAPDATAKREAPLPETVPAGGLIILRDGEPGDPEVVLSPVVMLAFAMMASIRYRANAATPPKTQMRMPRSNRR